MSSALFPSARKHTGSCVFRSRSSFLTTEVQRIERDKAQEFLLMLLDPMRDRFTAGQGINTGNFFVDGEFIDGFTGSSTIGMRSAI